MVEHNQYDIELEHPNNGASGKFFNRRSAYLEGDKAAIMSGVGPDGFPNFFFNKGGSFRGNFDGNQGFISEGVLTERVQHYAHCSSSKVPWSQSVERFQASPQSLCNTVYKQLSKILATNKTIGLSRSSQSWPNQEAIVKGRHIGEGVIIAHETIHSMDRRSSKKAVA